MILWGHVQHPESFTPIKPHSIGPAGLHVLAMFSGKPGASIAMLGLGWGAVTCPADHYSVSVCSVGHLHEDFGCWGS